MSRAGTYKKGDVVEYHSATHCEWLPATVTDVNSDSYIMLDVKPNVWISLEVQNTKVRPPQNAKSVGGGKPPPSGGGGGVAPAKPAAGQPSARAPPSGTPSDNGIRANSPQPSSGARRTPVRREVVSPFRAAGAHRMGLVS